MESWQKYTQALSVLAIGHTLSLRKSWISPISPLTPPTQPPPSTVALSCSVAEIVKSIVFKRRGDDGDKPPIVAVLCGDNRVCPDKLARLVGGTLDKADADFVKTHCGFDIGGVAPLAHRRPAEVFLENDLRRFPVIWVAAGSVFSAAPEAMAQAAEATVSYLTLKLRRKIRKHGFLSNFYAINHLGATNE